MSCRVPIIVVALATLLVAEEDYKDFVFTEPGEVMLAQESRHYQTFVKPPVRIVKPHGVTNSHRPQYDLDSFEEDLLDEFPTTKRYDFKAHKLMKEGMIKDAVLRALERKDHAGKFAQLLPIIRAMSGQQRGALASLVASQVSTPPGRTPLNLAQVRSMFGNSHNTTADLMLPILLDMANLIRRAMRSGKEPREVKQPLQIPKHPQLLRRSFTEDTYLDDEPFDTGFETTKAPRPTRTEITRRTRPQQRTNNNNNRSNRTEQKSEHKEQSTDTDTHINTVDNDTEMVDRDSDRNKTKSSSTTEATSTSSVRSRTTSSSKPTEGTTPDLTADATNQTLASDLPVAEKLRAYNRFVDRKGNYIRRGTYPPKPSPVARRTTAEPTLSPVIRRRPAPARKLPVIVADQGNCELFTNTLCLHSEDYPTEAIVQSIRRNKAAAGALLADFKDPGEGAFDGVTAAEEAKYTAAAANRRGDTNNRDFAAAGEAGFMCPSTVKYARPQRARATSGQWKYIVNTGEHTQTLRLEKCLKPKESCTFLTDNFKSKCVQVYNYHRLLTWDQQNGLHMDIFKVPTCCSCHIEGYSVSFPPLGHRNHETSNENFPGEDISAEHGNQAFEQVQQTIHRPTKTPPFLLKKPLEFSSSFSDNHNLLQGTPFQSPNMNDNDEFISNSNSNQQLSNPMDSYGNTYFTDSFNQATSVRNVKRPLRNPPSISNGFETVTLPSYLEPPTPSATSTFLTKETSKFKKQSQFKRGPSRPRRRPIRKKIGGPDDLTSSGTSAVENMDSLEDFNDDIEEEDVPKININNNSMKRETIAPKLTAVTTEMPSTSPRNEQKRVQEIVTVHGKRINYNYHPIIDFFNADDKNSNDSIDREDAVPSYTPSLDSEWKPINNPPSRSIPTNLVGRKKHK